MTNVVVFLGPTLSVADASKILDARYLPPAAQGDVLRAALEGPSVIAIIDGYFERVPAVWHKEILFAMSRGIHVFGASSMGALRAAELAAFGMEGVGRVYEDFANETLEADDEVAVTHGAADVGYRMSSEALVNIRATVAAAIAQAAVTPGFGAAILGLARSLFYPDRVYPRIIAMAREAGLPKHEIDRFEAFLKTGRVDQKRLDAVQLLEMLRQLMKTSLAPKKVGFHFEHTDAWEYMLAHSVAAPES